jgi:hypothetical protein
MIFAATAKGIGMNTRTAGHLRRGQQPDDRSSALKPTSPMT